MVASAEATEEVASLFPLEHCSKKARATLIYIRMSSVNKSGHAIMLDMLEQSTVQNIFQIS